MTLQEAIVRIESDFADMIEKVNSYEYFEDMYYKMWFEGGAAATEHALNIMKQVDK